MSHVKEKAIKVARPGNDLVRFKALGLGLQSFNNNKLSVRPRKSYNSEITHPDDCTRYRNLRWVLGHCIHGA
jgi:hypothetical protein